MYMNNFETDYEFLLVEPIAKTIYPPLGLMKIGSWLRSKYKKCKIFFQVGCQVPMGLSYPREIYITTLFTWHLKHYIKAINYYREKFPCAIIHIGGIAGSLLEKEIFDLSNIIPHFGLHEEAEFYPPDYSLHFGRKINTSITFTTRGCPRGCDFCSVTTIEPTFYHKDGWVKDIDISLKYITLWDNNFLVSPEIEKDVFILKNFKKRLDFNQGLDPRLYSEDKAKLLSHLDINPIRFAFDNIENEKDVISAIERAKKYSSKEIRVYVLYNFNDSPEDFYYRIDLLNKLKVCSFPMCYRDRYDFGDKFIGIHWDKQLLRAMALTLLFYYRKGMITDKRDAFLKVYGKNSTSFKNKLYEVYRKDKLYGK